VDQLPDNACIKDEVIRKLDGLAHDMKVAQCYQRVKDRSRRLSAVRIVAGTPLQVAAKWTARDRAALSRVLRNVADRRVVEAARIADFLKRVAVNAQRIVDALVALLFVRSRREESGGPRPGGRGLQRSFLDSDSPNQSPPTTSPGDSRVARHCQHGVAAQLPSYSAALSSPARPSDFPGWHR
jgi:hypothetical protein